MSLVEVLVFVAVIVPVVLAGATGLLTALRTTEAAQTRQGIETGLQSAAESLKVMPYRRCATAAQLTADHAAWAGRWVPPPGGRTAADGITVTGVQHWDPATQAWSTTCTTDGGAQRLTVQVRAAAPSTAATTGVVVKRDPAGVPAGTTADPVPTTVVPGAS